MYKSDFPLFSNTNMVYLDTAASAQKPEIVLKTMDDFYRTGYANIHRGQCKIATDATILYEDARQTVADFINAKSEEIIFTKGTTESINLVASGYEHILKPNDEVLVCIAEHHANFVPWQQVCLRTGAKFITFDVTDDGKIDIDDFKSKLSDKTKLVAIAHISNVLGVLNPVQMITELAHQVGAKVLVDGAQSIAHTVVDVKDIDCDFYVFSGHKIYGPTGIGVLYGRYGVLSQLPPYQFGGDMIKTVSVTETVFADVPARFEAGTTPFVEAIGLAEAIRYIQGIGREKIIAYEENLISVLTEIPNLEIIGGTDNKTGLCCFNISGVHPSDLAFILAKENVCVRTGHHCAMPIHQRFGQSVSLRVSLGIYNTENDIDFFVFKNGFYNKNQQCKYP